VALAFVDDPGDPRIEGYLDVREKDLARAPRGGLFVLEGENVLRVLVALAAEGRPGEAPGAPLQSLYRPRSVLVSESRAAARRELLARVPDDIPVFVASQAVLDRIVGFHLHRGVLALAERGEPRDANALLARSEARATVVVAVGITNHDNMGGIFRNAAALGANAVLLDATSCDPLYRKAVRVSVGGALVVPFARAPLATLVDGLAAQGFDVVALSPRGAVEVSDLRLGPRRALVLGTEGEGLPEAWLERLRTARIDQEPSFDSLNVAVACGIALHALRRGVG
jgi:tRNA G18 (ribose-2'-O)-methylase SpoU